MPENLVAGPWVEPAHPAIVKQFKDLTAIYGFIREKLQDKINQGFDRASSQIGFVVTTMLPATLEVPKRGPMKWSLAEPLQGSLFEKEMLEAIADPTPEPARGISAGTHGLYLVWVDALKLKLRKDWLEPVHHLRPDILERLRERPAVRPEVQEPAHWFHPGAVITAEDQVLISVIDEVYPELRLAERVSLTRQQLRRVVPDVMEPAHSQPQATAELALREIAQLLRRVRPEVMEPAHFRPVDRDILTQIEALLRRSGIG